MKKLLGRRYYARKARHHNRLPWGWVHSRVLITLTWELEWTFEAAPVSPEAWDALPPL